MTEKIGGDILLECDGQPARDRVRRVGLSFIVYALVGVFVYQYFGARGNAFGYVFLAFSVWGAAMAAILIAQSRLIDTVVLFEHGILLPYRAAYLVPFITGYNRVLPWSAILGVERRSGLILKLADGRRFCILPHHDCYDEMEELIKKKVYLL